MWKKFWEIMRKEGKTRKKQELFSGGFEKNYGLLFSIAGLPALYIYINRNREFTKIPVVLSNYKTVPELNGNYETISI